MRDISSQHLLNNKNVFKLDTILLDPDEDKKNKNFFSMIYLE